MSLTGTVRWKGEVTSDRPGIYIVSLSENAGLNAGLREHGPIAMDRVQSWISGVPGIELDGATNPKAEEIARRLSEFWLPDESVLYIGMTTQPLSKRIGQYYGTSLGKTGPHAGGHWIKTLSNLDDLFVYYAECQEVARTEGELIEAFMSGVSARTLVGLRDKDHPLPFANLEYPKGTKKNHGIRKSRKR